MVPANVFENLRALQVVLAQKNRLETEIAEAPKFLVAQEELLTRCKESFIEKNVEYESVREEVARLTTELCKAEKRREDAEVAMDNISTQREYDALDREIQEAKRQEVALRSEVARSDVAYKRLAEEIKLDQEDIVQQERELTENKARVDAEVRGKREQVLRLQEEERRLSPDLDRDVLFKFERIIKSKQGVGIVPVLGNVCAGCHMILPAQFSTGVREGNSIVYCPYCSRILYYEETDEPEMTFFDEEDLGSLSDLVYPEESGGFGGGDREEI